MARKSTIITPLLFSLEELEIANPEEWKLSNFSAHNYCPDIERINLENKYWAITEVTDKFNRQSVSYQLSKKDCLHRWLKYKEGFSAQLVKMLLNEFGIKKGDLVMDPFMGSGTTALVCCLDGINSIGYDILPMSKLSINAKTSVYDYNIIELQLILDEIKNLQVPDDFDGHTNSFIRRPAPGRAKGPVSLSSVRLRASA